MNTSVYEKAKKIKCLVTDLDGVLTNGYLYLSSNGDELKAFHVQDGMGLKLLMCADIIIACITTSTNFVVEKRMKQLGIEHFYMGQVNKEEAFSNLQKKLNLPLDAFAYIGDDLPDMSLIQKVGLGVAVNNAVKMVKDSADYVTEKAGGEGAMRELCDLILDAQDKSSLALDRYLTT